MTRKWAEKYPSIHFSSMHPGWADTPGNFDIIIILFSKINHVIYKGWSFRKFIQGWRAQPGINFSSLEFLKCTIDNRLEVLELMSSWGASNYHCTKSLDHTVWNFLLQAWASLPVSGFKSLNNKKHYYSCSCHVVYCCGWYVHSCTDVYAKVQELDGESPEEPRPGSWHSGLALRGKPGKRPAKWKLLSRYIVGRNIL